MKINNHDSNSGEVYKRNRRTLLLDTSFILSCIKNKIDLFEELQEYQIIIPKQVLVELEGLAKSKPEAQTALKIISRSPHKTLDLKSKNTDKAIIQYSKTNPETTIATLDREIQSKVKKKIVIRGKKSLETMQ